MHAEPSIEAVADRFLLDGYVVLPGVIANDVVGEALRLCEKTAARRSRVRVPVPYELLNRAPLKRIIDAPPVRALLVHLLGERCATEEICWFRISPPGGSAITRIHRDSRASGPLSISVDAMLTEFTEQNGATELWVGTQHASDRSANESDEARRLADIRPVTIAGPEGSVVLRDERAWHRAGVNRTTSARSMFSSRGWRSRG